MHVCMLYLDKAKQYHCVFPVSWQELSSGFHSESVFSSESDEIADMDSDADPIYVPETESDSSSAHHEDDTDLENVVPPTDAESDDSVPYPALIPAKTGTTFSRTQTENLQINPISSTVSTSKDNITVQSYEGRKSWM